MTSRRKCPYCSLNFDSKYIQRHLVICKNNTDQQVNSSYLEHANVEEGDAVIDDHVHELGHDGGCPILSESVFEEEPDNDDNNNQDTILSDNEFEELLFDEPREEFNNSNLLPDPNKLFLLQWLCIFIALWQSYFNISDSAIEMLIKFLKAFLTVLSEHFDVVTGIAVLMPSSLYMFDEFLGRSKQQNFVKYVVCIKCFKLYHLDQCHYFMRGEKTAKKCNNILFPNHPKKQFQKKCGQPLLRKISSRSGKECLLPYKVYCYMPLKNNLERLLKYPNFLENCNLWRRRPDNGEIMSDIYDGAIWKEFEDPEGLNFFENENNLAIMLNVDWFCPYKHVRSVSVGAIYAVFLNLPRELRFKKEFMILVGLIPNMAKEPPTNTFMKPLVDELLTAWTDGLDVKTTNGIINIKCALICVGCDIPASRKLCGFLGIIIIYTGCLKKNGML